MNMITWKKPSGVMVETNDHPDNIVAAMKLEWERQATKKPAKKKAATKK